jgi:hypothetical protein
MKEPETLAQRILHLEQQLESYARLHAEELAEMRKVLQGLKDELLSLYQRHRSAAVGLDDEAVGNGQTLS